MLSIDASVIVIFFLVWILLFILTKLFFNPLRKVMKEREDGIRKNKKAAEEAFSRYDQSVREIEESLKKARIASYATRDRFEKEALQEKERMVAEVSQEVQAQVMAARKQLDERMELLKKELENVSQELARNIEEKILE